MESIDYKKIYMLQDEILDLVFAEDTEFYLTGGTCLNRFYFEKRYSDDLDFFTNFSDTFPYSVREIINRICLLNMATISFGVNVNLSAACPAVAGLAATFVCL